MKLEGMPSSVPGLDEGLLGRGPIKFDATDTTQGAGKPYHYCETKNV